MEIPEEARLTDEELKALMDCRSSSLGDLGHMRFVAQQAVAKAAPIIEAQARKAEREYARAIIEGLLPLNGYGDCFYCGTGNKPDEELWHFDSDNIWNGNRLCLMHDDYKDARNFLAALKEEGKMEGRMVKFTVNIVQEQGQFVASSADAGGNDVVFGGHGATPYEALHALINELEEAELYQPD